MKKLFGFMMIGALALCLQFSCAEEEKKDENTFCIALTNSSLDGLALTQISVNSGPVMGISSHHFNIGEKLPPIGSICNIPAGSFKIEWYLQSEVGPLPKHRATCTITAGMSLTIEFKDAIPWLNVNPDPGFVHQDL